MSDLIDRQVAIEAIARRDTTDGTVKVFGGREVVEIIKSLPSAQPERKTGEHDGKKYEAGTDWMHCSECGYKTVWAGACMTPYCPWCGAYMKGEDDGSD